MANDKDRANVDEEDSYGEEKVEAKEDVDFEDMYEKEITQYEQELVAREGGFVGKSLAYIKERMEESEDYARICQRNDLGAIVYICAFASYRRVQGKEADFHEVSRHSARPRWKGSTVVNGPAAIREKARKPKPVVKGLSARQLAQINKNRSDFNLFFKIIENRENEKEEIHVPSAEELHEEMLKNRKLDNWHLIRNLPSVMEQKRSLYKWDRGIFRVWNAAENEFPHQPSSDLLAPARTGLVMPPPQTKLSHQHIKASIYPNQTEVKENYIKYERSLALVAAEAAVKEYKETQQRLEAEREQMKQAEKMRKRQEELDRQEKLIREQVEREYDMQMQAKQKGVPYDYQASVISSTVNSSINEQLRLASMKLNTDAVVKQSAGEYDVQVQISQNPTTTRSLQDLKISPDEGTMPGVELGNHISNGNEELKEVSVKKKPKNAAQRRLEAQNERARLDAITSVVDNDSANTKEKINKDEKKSLSNSSMRKFGVKNDQNDERQQHESGINGKLSHFADYTRSVFSRMTDMSYSLILHKDKPTKVNPTPIAVVSSSSKYRQDAGGGVQMQTLQVNNNNESGNEKERSNNGGGENIGELGMNLDDAEHGSQPPGGKSMTFEDEIKERKKRLKQEKREKKKKLKERQQSLAGNVNNVETVEEKRVSGWKEKWEKAKQFGSMVYLEILVLLGLRVKPVVTISYSLDKEDVLATSKKWMEEKNDEFMVANLIRSRTLQKLAQEKFNYYFKCFHEDEEIYTPETFVRCSVLGKYNKVIDHLQSGMDVNAVTINGETPTYAAILRLMQGAPVDEEDEDYEAPTCWSKIFKSKKIPGRLDWVVKILLASGGDINHVKIDREKDGYALAHVAADMNFIDLLDWLKNKNADMNILSRNLNRTPLMVACKKNNELIVNKLLHYGAIESINHADADGNSCLHFTSIYASCEILLLVMYCGALITRNKGNRLPIEEAQSRGRIEFMEVMRAFHTNHKVHRAQIQFLDKCVEQNSSVWLSSSIGT